MDGRARYASPPKLHSDGDCDHLSYWRFLHWLLLRATAPGVRADHYAADPTRSDDSVSTKGTVGLRLIVDLHRRWARTTADVCRTHGIRPLVVRAVCHWTWDLLFLADSGTLADTGRDQFPRVRRAPSS